MKKIIYILLIISINCNAQEKRDYSNALKAIGFYTASITLNAVGDGLNDSGIKEWGHFCNATSAGVLLASPFVIDFKKQDWGWHAAAYILMRMAIFDIVYNLTRGLAWNYHGGSGFWDDGWNAFNPPGWAEGFCRFAFFSLAITIPLQNIK